MFQRRIPEWLRHAPTPSIKGFAILAGVESATRGILVSVFPIMMYRAFGDAETVSEIYFLVGLFSFVTALLTPWFSRYIPRKILYTIATFGLFFGALSASTGDIWLVPLGLGLTTISVVMLSICFNSYVMDYVQRSSLGESETLRLFYSGAAWSVGPYLGILLMDYWTPAPFILSAFFASCLLVTFWVMRLGNGKVIRKALAPTPNPLAFLPRFLAQPRLIGGWCFAVVRSCAWWVYCVYLPIYAVENGYSEQVGGLCLSITNGLLFTTPFMLKWIHKKSIKYAVQLGFYASSAAFFAAWLFSDFPLAAIGLLMFGTLFMILLDICAGLPFLMAVKPSERTEMSAIYSTFRDVSGVLTPGIARLVLAFAPLSAVFAVMALGLAATGLVARQLHPRLGVSRRQPAAYEKMPDVQIPDLQLPELQIDDAQILEEAPG